MIFENHFVENRELKFFKILFYTFIEIYIYKFKFEFENIVVKFYY